MKKQSKRKKTKLRITDRDIEILSFCHEQRFVTILQIARKFYKVKNPYKCPLRRINRMMEWGLIRTLKQGIGKTTLYVLGLKGIRELEKRGLLKGLGYVQGVDWKRHEQTLWLTDTRIIFEMFGFIWMSGKALDALEHTRMHLADAVVKKDEHLIHVVIDREHWELDGYKLIFGKKDKAGTQGILVYVVRDEKRKIWILRNAKYGERIYVISIDELRARAERAIFTNSSDGELVLEDLIDPRKTPERDKRLEIFRKADRVYSGLYSRREREKAA
ncbi:MAG: hypothetical protein H6757_06800 [Candidatus Omnitrophica bacterium]|nr:hypothetical protein [Candidatus Omnitrophota bacterium]